MTQELPLEAWKLSPYVYSHTKYEEVDEQEIDTTKITWLATKTSLGETPQESLETRHAQLEQVQQGVINELGIPLGFSYDELGISKEQATLIEAKKSQLEATKRHQISMQPRQSTPIVQHQARPEFNNKYERNAWREKQRELAKDQEKKARLLEANKKILMHQAVPHNIKDNPLLRGI